MTEGIILIPGLEACIPYGRKKNCQVDLAYLKMGIMIRKSRKHHIFNFKKSVKCLWTAAGIPFTGL
jgi:hypothetical protein